MSRPTILVTNDDGITAPGIRALVEVASEFGEVIVVAPDSPQSGKGHALTLEKPLRLKKVDIFDGITAYKCTGTPVDCVKMAKDIVLNDRLADLCVSGINHGSNASLNIIYSGTMSAAMEASFEGIKSIGFSLTEFSHKANLEPAKKYMRHIIKQILEHGMPNTNLINVNIPYPEDGNIKGVKVCRQAKAKWVEEYLEREDPMGGKYYWLTGKFVNQDEGTDSDVWALENNYVSVVPALHDLTDYNAISGLKNLEL